MFANILVWGETGDGKSTLINALVGREVAAVGRAPGGVTKEVTPYEVPELVGHRTPNSLETVCVRLWDMPGVGDKDMPAYCTLQHVQAALGGEQIAGILLLSSRPERMSIGAQITTELMNMSFVGEDKWACVALVGTKSDRYDEGDAENFTGPVLREFNNTTRGNITKAITVNRHNVQPVRDLLVQLVFGPSMGSFNMPTAGAVAQFVVEVNGMQEELARKRREEDERMERERRRLEEMERRLAERQSKEQLAEVRRQRHSEYMQHDHGREMKAMRRNLEQQQRENRRRQEELQAELRRRPRPSRGRRDGCPLS